MRKTRVLIVEDETIIALDVQGILAGLGYEVAGIASTGEAAVQKALSLKPDIILMDILLAGKMDGIDAAREIRKTHDIPIIYLTANADRATVDRAHDTLPYAYLNKPIHERDLYSNIESARTQHRIESKLRESERRFRDALANARLLAVQLDIDGTILFCNDFMLEVTGYKRDELMGADWFALFEPGEAPQRLKRAYRDALRADRMPHHFDGAIRTREGETRIVRWNITPLYDLDGVPYGTSSIGEDITESKRYEENLIRANQELSAANEELNAAMEELEAGNEELGTVNEELHYTLQALERKESEFRDLFESMAQGVVYHDQSGAIVDANTSAARMLGLSKDQLLGRTSLDPRWRAIREDGSEFPDELHPAMESLRTGSRVEGTIMGVYIPEEDRYRWISVSAIPQFREGDTRPYRVFVTFTDITEIRTTQEALRDNQRLMERALSMAGLGYWELDLTKGTATGSAESRRIYGLGDGELTIADIQKLPLPEYRPVLDRAIERLVKHNERYDVTFKIRRATDGAILSIHSLAEYNRSTNRIFGVLSVIPDGTS